MNKNEEINEVVAAWAAFKKELNVSLVGLMDLPEKRAMGLMCMAVSALRECEMLNEECGMDGVDADVEAQAGVCDVCGAVMAWDGSDKKWICSKWIEHYGVDFSKPLLEVVVGEVGAAAAAVEDFMGNDNDMSEKADAVKWSDKMATAPRVRAREKCRYENIDVRWMVKAGLVALVLVESLEKAAVAINDEGKVLLDQSGGVYLFGLLAREEM